MSRVQIPPSPPNHTCPADRIGSRHGGSSHTRRAGFEQGVRGGCVPRVGSPRGGWPPLWERELELRARLQMPALSAIRLAAETLIRAFPLSRSWQATWNSPGNQPCESNRVPSERRPAPSLPRRGSESRDSYSLPHGRIKPPSVFSQIRYIFGIFWHTVRCVAEAGSGTTLA